MYNSSLDFRLYVEYANFKIAGIGWERTCDRCETDRKDEEKDARGAVEKRLSPSDGHRGNKEGECGTDRRQEEQAT